MSIIQTIGSLSSNPVFAAMVGGGALGGLIMAGRSIPAMIWRYGKRRLTVTLTVRGTQDAYGQINDWLGRRQFAKKARSLQLTRKHNTDEEDWTFTVGMGNHLVRHNGKFVWINRSRAEKGSESWHSLGDETIELTTLGLSQNALRHIITEAGVEYRGGDTVRIYFWDESHFSLADNKRKRSLSTIYIPDQQKLSIVHDIQSFYDKQAVYITRGIPWRRGYLLRGEPGTGKSSLIFALASQFNRPIYIINLANVGGDQGLQRAMSEAGSGGFILMEDIDSVAVTHDRATTERKQDLSDDQDKGTLTLAGILNAIDGVASREGRILFITSNHADKLDQALIRPGRIDFDTTIDLINGDVARRMTTAFNPDFTDAEFKEKIAIHLPTSAANLQGILLQLENGSGLDVQNTI